MDTIKQKEVINQYITQYQPLIKNTMSALRGNDHNLHIPFAQFLFSVIDYYGILYSVAKTGDLKKRNVNNFKPFFSSTYFPDSDRCKASFLYFMRNGLIHQIFPKMSSVGIGSGNALFYKDPVHNIPSLDLTYLDKVTMLAISAFNNDLNINATMIENLHRGLIIDNYALSDDYEFQNEIKKNYKGNENNLYNSCI